MENIKYRIRCATILPFVLSILLIASCSNDSVQSMNIVGGTVTPSPEIQVTIAGTSTPVIVNTIPTATPLPTPKPDTDGLAARVNGQPITLVLFNAEMTRYLAGDPSAPNADSPEGKQLATQLKDIVLSTLIDRSLIAQEAARNNIVVTDKMIDDEVANLIDMRGGQDGYKQWLDGNKQTDQDIRDAVRSELLASIMRDRIVEQLPRTAEYVHAYQIVLQTEAAAQNALAKLKAGAKFTTLAQTQSIDLSTKADGGDLGWFTRGTGVVLWSEVEDAAFALKAGQVSPVVHSPIGYHVIKVVERQTRALTPNDTAFIQQATLEQWINRLRTNAKIEKFI